MLIIITSIINKHFFYLQKSGTTVDVYNYAIIKLAKR